MQALIAVWSKEKTQHHLEDSVRNERVYTEMVYRLSAIGTAQPDRVEKRVRLKQGYKKHKDHSNRSGADQKHSSGALPWTQF